MLVFSYILIVIYTLCLLFILFYGFAQAHLGYLYLKNKDKKQVFHTQNQEKSFYLPKITIQLPIYNEKYVVERLLNAISELHYPKNQLEIQILDDSTDETSQIIKKIVQDKFQSFDTKHLQRQNRIGYKAGALNAGLLQAQGEFIAIFDADFLPQPNFLTLTIPYFQNPNIGLVQTRWGHINKGFSLMTRLQAFGLDLHFSVEQAGRNKADLFMNFNGTAGIWRRKSIELADAWHADTIAEDLDLSYRCQLKGIEFAYLEHIITPAELPVTINALKQQQARWAKGAAECAKKHLKNVWKNKNISTLKKIHATCHLLNSLVFVCGFASALLSVPLLYVKNEWHLFSQFFSLASVFIVSFLILIGVCFISERQHDKPLSVLAFFKQFVLFVAFNMGLSLSNARATLEGYWSIKTPFLRTPKFNINTTIEQPLAQKNDYEVLKMNWVNVFEAMCLLYFLGGIGLGIYFEDYGLIPFHGLLSVGFGMVLGLEMGDKRRQKILQISL